jgi:hypothetical protein
MEYGMSAIEPNRGIVETALPVRHRRFCFWEYHCMLLMFEERIVGK